ncbi:MAG TPA: glucose 1-dehydrogenase [Steroidobacteraceae bacterium]|nr:glucose 1-dehydrogenase [Steroidobacteraceae bacterium]
MSDLTFNFSGKTALVMGATAGIGQATVEAFARAGANVVFAGLGGDAGRAIEREVRHKTRAQVHFIECDVRRQAEVEAAAGEVVERFGSLDIAVNNAGIEGRFGPVQDATADDFEQIIGVNLRGVWHGLKAQIPRMLTGGRGAIVNTASSAGVTGIANVALYTASKHAVVGLTKATALELADSGIRVNAVAPGPVDTGLLHRMVAGHIDISAIAASVPMRRISRPEEIAGAILWLCSDAASYVTGHTLVVDGGMTVP